MSPSRLRPAFRLFAALALIGPAASSALAQQKPDYDKLVPTLNGQVPRVVPTFPFSSFPVATRPMFDHFMWQNFIAVMWPSRPEDRGEPYRPDDPEVWRKGYVDGLQPAFLGWKSADELYPGDGKTVPPAWDQAGSYNPCKDVPTADDAGRHRMFLIHTSKFGTVADEVDQAFAGPLIDQTGLLTRYEVRINKPEYDYIRDHGYYDHANWPASGAVPISLPQSTPDKLGSMEVKAAWRDLSKLDPKYHGRFFTTRAVAVEANTCKNSDTQPFPIKDCTCKDIEVGLVGFHVTQKTEQFPQWVWSTFEQVDNLGEDGTTPEGMTPSYHSGARPNPAAHPGYSYEPNNAAIAKKLTLAQSVDGENADLGPVNVARLSAIPLQPQIQVSDGQGTRTLSYGTDATNTAYRTSVLKDTIWAHYWLIGTQWSTSPGVPAPSPFQASYANAPPPDFGCEDGTPAAVGGMAFPACQLANITMETYHQYDSCQNCHQGAQRGGADFSWTLFQRAYSPPPPKTADARLDEAQASKGLVFLDRSVIRRRPE